MKPTVFRGSKHGGIDTTSQEEEKAREQSNRAGRVWDSSILSNFSFQIYKHFNILILAFSGGAGSLKIGAPLARERSDQAEEGLFEKFMC